MLFRYDFVSIFHNLNNFILKYLKNIFLLTSINIVSPNLGLISSAEVALLPSFNTFFSFKPKASSLSFFSYFCGVDNIVSYLHINTFLVYQGSFKINNFIFNRANLILPITTFIERKSTFLNLEGRLRFSKQAIIPFKNVFDDLEILSALFIIKKYNFYLNFSFLNNFYFVLSFFVNIFDYKCIYVFNLKNIFQRSFFLLGLNLQSFVVSNMHNLIFFSKIHFTKFSHKFFFINSLINTYINNYYSTDIFSKNSKILSLQAIKAYKFNFSVNILNQSYIL